MSRIVLVAASLAAAAPLAAQQAGDHVRLAPVSRTGDEYTPLRYTGVLVRSDVDSVVVREGDRRVAVATRDVHRLELRTGTRSRAFAALRWGALGALVGTAAGGAVAATNLGDVSCPAAVGYACDSDRSDDRRRAVVYGAVGGAGLGALYGGMFAWASWRDVPLPGGGRVGFVILPGGISATVAR